MSAPPRVPFGWYLALRTDTVGTERPVPFAMGPHEYVAFRDREGAIQVLDAHCPHLGAHLGHGGHVVEGRLRCPFHRLEFDGQGTCVAAREYYDPERVRHVRAQRHAFVERFGLLFVWHGPNPTEPDWPFALDALDWSGWTPAITNEGRFVANANPLWVPENLIDTPHLTTLHRWDLEEVLEPPAVHGDGSIRTRVRVRWRLGAQSENPRIRALGRHVHSPFELHAWATDPGMVVTTATLSDEQGGFELRNVVLATPLLEGGIQLRVLVAVKRQLTGGWVRAIRGATGWTPEDLLARIFLQIGTRDFEGDASVWRHRKHLEAPQLIAGDGPVVAFRRWSMRFWPATADDQAAPGEPTDS